MPSSLDFGDVPVGTSVTRAFQITNTGNVPMTITKAKAPQGVFSTTTPIAEGLKIPAGESAYQSVTFTPTAVGQAGTSETYYLITTDDGQGALKVMLTGNGTDDPIAAYAWKIGAGDPRSALGRSLTVEYAVAWREVPGLCQRGDLLVTGDRGAFGHSVRSTPVTRPQAAPRASSASRPPTRRARRTGWGGTTTSPVRAGPRSTGRRRPGRTLSRVRSGPNGRRWAAETGPLGYPITDEKAHAGRSGAVQPLLRCGRGTRFTGRRTTGAHSVTGAVRAKWASLGWETGPGLSDHRHEGVGGRRGAVQPLLRCGWKLDLTGRRRPGRTMFSVRSGPSGRHWAGRQARWAIRSRTRRAPRTAWGGTTTSPVRVGPRSTGRRRPGRTR